MLPPLLVIVSYLIGSIPFSFLVARAFGQGDLRQTGSGNVGATNVLRLAGRRAGLLALLLDLLKGWAVVFIARTLIETDAWPIEYASGQPLAADTFWIGLSAFLAVIGHMFPIWLHFRGGKGVATATGTFLAVAPLATGAGLVVFLVVLALSRYVSLGSMAAAAAMPLIIRFVTGGTIWTVVFAILISVSVILKHRTNIARLVAGEERRFPR